jgi:hypothetical protein
MFCTAPSEQAPMKVSPVSQLVCASKSRWNCFWILMMRKAGEGQLAVWRSTVQTMNMP